ncbi:hypothetical protein BBW65_01240 [Helicobacter enhydrae]|uniref:Uncharacterized protein n=1 Tax=Helicobacter enhydrae TaxID=222136 RepID=A0A1B1U490_9HELI|nr:hypothetical protein [Helicobacter enhydrae]ANV97515.1 hypothetical protein BBW65_01240 [Helicobacter enhydrae]
MKPLKPLIITSLLAQLVWADVYTQSILQSRVHQVNFERKMQRVHFEQMRFWSLDGQRAWGLANLAYKHTFIGAKDDYFGLIPLIGFDGTFALEDSTLVVGFDVSGHYRTIQTTSDNANSKGYGLGGAVMWKTPQDYTLGVSVKWVQSFWSPHNIFNHYGIWLLDIENHKRFWFDEGVFIDLSEDVGVGFLWDSEVSFHYGKSLIKHAMDPYIPINLGATLGVGRVIDERHEIKVTLRTEMTYRIGGALYINYQNQINQERLSQTSFDLFGGFIYNFAVTKDSNLYTYAELDAFNFAGYLGVGIRMSWGEVPDLKMKYPKLQLKKLPNTDLK